MRSSRPAAPGQELSKLTAVDVVDIYGKRPQRTGKNQTFAPSSHISRELSQHYKICERSIRDIWNRRSWRQTTRHLWSAAELAGDPVTAVLITGTVLPAQRRKPGRPRGGGLGPAQQSTDMKEEENKMAQDEGQAVSAASMPAEVKEETDVSFRISSAPAASTMPPLSFTAQHLPAASSDSFHFPSAGPQDLHLANNNFPFGSVSTQPLPIGDTTHAQGSDLIPENPNHNNLPRHDEHHWSSANLSSAAAAFFPDPPALFLSSFSAFNDPPLEHALDDMEIKWPVMDATDEGEFQPHSAALRPLDDPFKEDWLAVDAALSGVLVPRC